jgi:hypothetical protein
MSPKLSSVSLPEGTLKQEFVMKGLLFISLISLSSVAVAEEWKVIAETVSCPENVKIMAKEGEKYVLASHGNTQRKLYSLDGSAFSAESLSSTEFASDKQKESYLVDEPTYTFTQPGYVEGNPPKLDVFKEGKKEHCRMNLK